MKIRYGIAAGLPVLVAAFALASPLANALAEEPLPFAIQKTGEAAPAAETEERTAAAVAERDAERAAERLSHAEAVIPVETPAAQGAEGVNMSETANARQVGVFKGRDPFWPVGRAPDKRGLEGTNGTTIVKVPDEWDRAEKMLRVSPGGGQLRGKIFVMINGKGVSEGDEVSLVVGNRLYVWILKSAILSKDSRKPEPVVQYERVGTREVAVRKPRVSQTGEKR